jgi:hypothetical protein
MRSWRSIGAIGFVAAAALLATSADAGAPPTSASPVASPTSCPVTQPNGNQPPPEANVFGRGNGDYGNDVLWTSLWIWGEGEVDVPADHLLPDGSLGDLKWAWYRYVPGELTIEDHRLDGDAPPFIGEVPEGYGDEGFQPSGLTFPTGGCWEVTGWVGAGSLTFVVLVVPPAATGAPEPVS